MMLNNGDIDNARGVLRAEFGWVLEGEAGQGFPLMVQSDEGSGFAICPSADVHLLYL